MCVQTVFIKCSLPDCESNVIIAVYVSVLVLESA
jgi:hypothetical protein